MAGVNEAGLEAWGWAPDFAESCDRFLESAAVPEHLFPARVASISRGVFHVAAAEGEIDARVLKRVRTSVSGPPAVGDWVVVESSSVHGVDPRIVHVLDRRSRLSRKAAGARTEEQVVAANIDAVGTNPRIQPTFFEISRDDCISTRGQFCLLCCEFLIQTQIGLSGIGIRPMTGVTAIR